MASTLIMSPYSVDFSQPKLLVKGEAKAELPYQRDLLFISDKNLNEVVSKFMKDKKEQVLQATNINVVKKEKKTSFDGFEDIAVNIKDVKSDRNLQKELSKAYKKGSKVYLFGGVTFEEYKNLLEIDTVSIKDKGKTVAFTADKDKLAKEKGKLKENPDRLDSDDEFTYDIIGYTSEEGEANQLMVSTINVVDENSKKIPTTDVHIIQEVLGSTFETVDIEEQNYAANQQNKLFGFFSPNKAEAEVVKSNPARIFGNAYFSSSKVGYTATDWYLNKAGSDGEADYDYFFVEDRTSAYASGGWKVHQIKTDHDIPYDTDKIKEWDPQDDS